MAEIGTALVLLFSFFLMWVFTSPEDVREEFENEIREGLSDGSIEREYCGAGKELE